MVCVLPNTQHRRQTRWADIYVRSVIAQDNQYMGNKIEDCGSIPKNKDISSTFCLGDANRSKGGMHDTKEANTEKCDNELLDRH